MGSPQIDLSAGFVPKSAPPGNQSIDLSAGFVPKAQPKPEPSAIPSGSDWLHAAGLPASMAEAELTPKQALQLGAINILHAADPTYLFRNFAVPMVKEGGRAVKGIFEHGGIPEPMDAVHAASAINPFAAPVVDRMSELREQGKEGEATATGVIGAGTLAMGLAAPKVAPPATRVAIRVANKALNPAAVGAAGGSFAGPVGAAAGAEVLPEIFPGWAARAQKGIIPTPEWAAKSTAQMQLFRGIGKIAARIPDTATAESHPATVAAVKNAFDELSARMIDVPNLRVQPGPQPPVNLLEAQTSPAALRGAQGEFPVIPSEPATTGATPPAATAPETSSNMAGYYGKYSGKSNLTTNLRQLASPTGSTAPLPNAGAPHPPQIMEMLTKPGELTDSDMSLLKRYDFNKRAWRPGAGPRPGATQAEQEDDALSGILRESIRQAQAGK